LQARPRVHNMPRVRVKMRKNRQDRPSPATPKPCAGRLAATRNDPCSMQCDAAR
jgi:hypothetical protein